MNQSFPLVSAPGSFSVTQWNTLADSLAMGFPLADPSYLTWDHRFPRHIQHLKQNAFSDLICLEEVDHAEEFTAAFAQTHTTIFHKKPEGKDGQLIAISKSKFDILDSKPIQFQIGGESEAKQTTNQSFWWVKLREKSTQKILTLFVTHLKAKPEFEDIRIQQINYLLSFLHELKDVSIENSAVILLGDLNTDPNCKTVQNILHAGFSSAYNLTDESLFTTFKIRKPGHDILHTIDYIFYAPHALKLVGTRGLPNRQTIGDNGLPNEQFPSDHLSISAVFSFKE